MPDSAASTTTHASIWDKHHISLTTGSILAITIVAFQGLALATIAPVLADDIGGRDLYGWIFSAFLLPQIIGTVLGGREVDRRSPAHVFLINLILFTIGCLVAGGATSIYMLFVGRSIQGFGAGGISSCVYAVVSAGYEDRLRPSMLAAMSSAWIVPSLIGPTIAGFVAEQLSWRYAFFGLVPILLVIAPLTLPAYARIERKTAPSSETDNRLMISIGLAMATGLFLVGLELRPWAIGAAVAAIGLAGLVPTLRRLLPEGAFTARPVMPAAIVTRGLGFGGFAVVETYMIFSLKEFGGVSATQAGLVLTVASLMWTGGSLIQARWDRMKGASQRPLRIVVGFSILFAATLYDCALRRGAGRHLAVGRNGELGVCRAGHGTSLPNLDRDRLRPHSAGQGRDGVVLGIAGRSLHILDWCRARRCVAGVLRFGWLDHRSWRRARDGTRGRNDPARDRRRAPHAGTEPGRSQALSASEAEYRVLFPSLPSLTPVVAGRAG